MTKEYVDIAVIVPLEEELQAFFEHFPSKENRTSDDFFIHLVDSGASDVSMVAVHPADMGHAAAGQSAAQLLSKYHVGLIVCLGIAGSLSGDMRLGDVCYSGAVVDVYENSKAVDVGKSKDGFDVELSPEHYQTDSKITLAFNYMRTQPELKEAYDVWTLEREQHAQATCAAPVMGRKESETLGAPRSKNGSIVCGVVSKSEKYNDKLKGIQRRVLAIETEAGAVFRAAKAAEVEAITVRGISDYADRNKGALEESSAGNVRSIAASNAVTFFKLQLSNSYFLTQIARVRPHNQLQMDLETKSLPLDTPDVVEAVANAIDAQLRELSPEYRLQPVGYRMPAPRVRRYDGLRTAPGEDYRPPQELRSGLEIDKRILISVPRSYPDQSLAWVIAQDLLDAELDGKQAVPIVIDGDRMGPPNRGIEHLADIDVKAVLDDAGKQPVFIIDNLPLGSSTKIKFLISEVDAFDTAHFVFLSPAAANTLSESELKIELSLGVYALCDVSFIEISNFIQRAFALQGAEAEVVAKRLWDTFAMFGLSAHPTYFAGIPRETLTALLNANRRSELIQLAVDGFLSFVVAGDDSEVTLSRTTRARFLKDLAVELRVERRRFNRSQLVARVSLLAEQQDFDIDPLSFLKGFEEQGILHFDDRNVEFSLPFIERYLLARALADDSKLAKRYFDLSSFDFDPQVFDLYAEIGPDTFIKDTTRSAVDDAIENLEDDRNETHLLLDDSLRPSVVASMDRVRALKDKLDRAVDDVHEGRTDAKKKQRLLDLADRVKETSAKHAREEFDEDSVVDELDRAIRSFQVGIMLLGSGVEHLNAEEKRALASSLIRLGSDIVDIWTDWRSSLDFAAFKEALLSDKTLMNAGGENGDAPSPEELKSLVSGVVDMLEGAALSEPLRVVLGLMCEQARSKVLAKSLMNVQPEAPFEKLLHAAWLTDVSPDEGKRSLKDVGAKLPPAAFMRSCMAMHCLSRAFWSHWRKPDRLSLLDAADEFLKPIAASLNKAKLKREIESSE